VDEFISEAVLAKLEERSARATEDAGPWPGGEELRAVEEQIRELGAHWRQRKLSSSVYFEQLLFWRANETDSVGNANATP
jgi:hypothetical protein